MIKIRLARGGTKNKPFFRIVAIDERKKVRGSAIDLLGTWNPKKNTKIFDKTKIDAWIKKGAILSPAVKKLIGD
ncbi:30S ribosomal protein S16 [Candidatus Woesebacteria bacterium RIFCSPLOWO2_01_FULL_39_23]|uniref:Small ribosomal subunit protein bS16 n=1 Tax=Candidatus Woesebacteria bacterium RIFCSPHIGHO2_01_FULL_40_22 TaxID=1802499 RepID=A0A1F7YJ42_9BACT|nr:MAG: 30S ribosomal protein S16 [Candidatus Woesebacteria bacterium RBG_16_40_11]OGM27374.1 MAG: 30S ribosomal protein S16 [Candidatus Woesebacteria bacterium RIFCSPHIGHO2_01_FULL_40_22]OGM37265.1 MAG: 30S ribosomal protein S16 [Candidatus Woesebacteria bacterium RIFCSPHIGHO2_12_FULL_38_9]OGM62546.1 MAG: 30S ribosomal protein S16 [Candidatus Woesebacteria bacterium RIFCSPLOWO2_01_FULL_39_23]